MIVLPAIDILGGKAVRLAQGDYRRVTIYNDSPVEQARIFAQGGARWIHVVDLDGARSGKPANIGIVRDIIAATGLSVEVGGGVRSLDTLQELVSAGARRVVLGTKLVTDPGFVRSAVAAFGDIVSAGVDARFGEVAIEGWREGAGIPAVQVVGELCAMGVRHLVYTDISRDGMQTGIDAGVYATIVAASGVGVTESGGLSSLVDIEVLAAIDPVGSGFLEGAITGRAIYEGAFTLEEALEKVSASASTARPTEPSCGIPTSKGV
jgi:phosphoribosylformimino-5-aminoimidazole carboxamide ribotide isomerase